MARVPQDNDKLHNHLREQVSFLCRSARAFDEGYEDEAKRLAHVLRVLLHDTRASHSLLGQLGILDRLLFRDTAIPFRPNLHGQIDGLTRLVISVTVAKASAPLDDLSLVFNDRLRRFADWWVQPVVRDNNDHVFTRKGLVINVCNTDGGSHVDPGLDASYAALTADNSMGWWTTVNGVRTPIPAPHLPSIRQISHEFLCSLAYVCPETFVNSEDLAHHRRADFTQIPLDSKCNAGRNDQCPCGSGLKYKKCHLLIKSKYETERAGEALGTHCYGPSTIDVIRTPKPDASEGH